MRKLISVVAVCAMAMGMMTALPVNAAGETFRVEAEEKGVSAIDLPESDSSNSKIIKSTDEVTYYVQNGNPARATMFKLSEISAGEEISVNVTLNSSEWKTEIEYSLFVSESIISLDSTRQTDTKEALPADAEINTNTPSKGDVTLSIPQITADKDGYVYLYIGCGDVDENNNINVTKVQWSFDYFDVTISDDSGSTEPEEPSESPSAEPDETTAPTATAAPTAKPTVSPTATPIVYPENAVQAEETGVALSVGKNGNNCKIEKTGNDLVYYVNGSEKYPQDPVGTIFKLKEANIGDKIDIDVTYKEGTGGIEYAVFTAENDSVTLSSINISDVKNQIPATAKYKELLLTGGHSYVTDNLVTDYTADKDGWVYLYIGTAKSVGGADLVNGKHQNKFQMNIDYFTVDITPGEPSTEPSVNDYEYRTADGTVKKQGDDMFSAPYWTFTKTFENTDTTVTVGFKSSDTEKTASYDFGTNIASGNIIFSVFVTGENVPDDIQACIIE